MCGECSACSRGAKASADRALGLPGMPLTAAEQCHFSWSASHKQGNIYSAPKSHLSWFSSYHQHRPTVSIKICLDVFYILGRCERSVSTSFIEHSWTFFFSLFKLKKNLLNCNEWHSVLPIEFPILNLLNFRLFVSRQEKIILEELGLAHSSPEPVHLASLLSWSWEVSLLRYQLASRKVCAFSPESVDITCPVGSPMTILVFSYMTKHSFVHAAKNP